MRDVVFFFWPLVTRLGELQVLLPAVLLAVLSLALRRETRRMAVTWLALVAGAVALTLASKLAFMGWGLGWSRMNFTGVSGHAMLAAALLPVLLVALVPTGSSLARGCALGLGAALALLVGASRMALGAHSPSEVVAGLVLGGVVTALVLTTSRRAAGQPQRAWVLPVAALVAVGLWLTLSPAYAPRVDTHGLVTQLSLQLSGRSTPWSRADMLRERRRDNKTLPVPDQSARQRLQQASS